MRNILRLPKLLPKIGIFSCLFFFFLVALSIIAAGVGRLISNSAFSPPLPKLGTGRPNSGSESVIRVMAYQDNQSIFVLSLAIPSGHHHLLALHDLLDIIRRGLLVLGASGIAPSIVDQFSSIMVEVIGFCNATAPAE